MSKIFRGNLQSVRKQISEECAFLAEDETITGDWTFPSIRIDSGALLSPPVAGTLEFFEDRLYITNVDTQRAIDRTSDVITSTTTVSNTTTETTIYTGTIDANALKAGNVVKYIAGGVISNDSASDDITIRVKIGSTTVETFNPAIGNVTGAVWGADGRFTIRSVGASGSAAYEGRAFINKSDERVASIETIDTTVSEDLTVTVQWDNAKAGNTISIYQGVLEFKN